MIRYDLICKDGHEFEAWFRDSAAFDEDKKKRRLECPVCQTKKVDKAIMAPGIPKKSNQQTDSREKFVQMVRQVEKHVTENFDYVGEDFADEARAMHYGDAEKRDIYGETTLEDAVELIEEGIEVTPLPNTVPSKKQN
ncbi:MAG: DUF1178 family protein [Parvibaculales bacterium]